MILISPTRTLPSPRPIDTDPILNYRHIQPAAAVAAVGPWLCQHQHDSPPLSPNHHNSTVIINNSNTNINIDINSTSTASHSNNSHHSLSTLLDSSAFTPQQHSLALQQRQQQPFTICCPSPKQSSARLLSPSSEISASPTPSTFSLPLSAPTTTSTAAPPTDHSSTLPPSVSKITSSCSTPPALAMLPNPNSDDESLAVEEEQKPSIKPCHLNNLNTPNSSSTANNSSSTNSIANNNNSNNTHHQLDSHPPAVSLYDLPASSSAPTTSSSSSPFPSNNIPQQSSYSSSPHPTQEHQHHPHSQHHHTHHENQFYQPSPPPAIHSPLQSAHHHNQQQQQQQQPQQQHSFDQRPHSSSLYAHHHQRYSACPQSAPPSTSHIPLDPHVMAAAAANVEVKKWDEENTFYYQVAYKGVTVGRLKGSQLVNGTKLLNLAGISRGKRDGILKNEKTRKVVKHGTMHLKGVWIAFERAVFLAEQHNIADKIFPLLVVNLEEYMPIEQPLMAGGSKLGPGSLFHHHHPRHPRLLPQPIKYPHPALSLGPASANSFSSTGGWPGSTSSALPSMGFSEPFSAPPIPRSGTTGENSSSIYEQAQFQYLSSAQSTNPDLLERRHTIPNNHFHGYNSVAPYGSSQHANALTYPFLYNAAQLTGGYPPRSSASESTSPSQFEYASKHHINGNHGGSENTTPSYTSSLYHSQTAPRPSSSNTAQGSPPLPSEPILLSQLSPAPSCQLLDQVSNDFRLSTAAAP
ncbi:hypothetical protein PCANC_16903 [Puccinia coronata f. sp. avenae]|uniref:HTH APSES-type domain-containing protein n=1 Tax=Puccinia coronata f. sp. avenae TaxID=200324 RepID=A0A2N5SNQ9_9BASI|nr:hypothetical protein PCANC_16903 [Puccinia coronata f. sp. avenae]